MSFTAVLAAGHAVAAAVWVGGIFFAYMACRPAAMALEPPARLTLWAGAFGRFFPRVWLCIALLLGTGGALMPYAGGAHVTVMAGIGTVMVLLFCYLFFLPFPRLKAAVAAGDWPGAAAALARMRPIMATNLVLGLATIAIASAGTR